MRKDVSPLKTDSMHIELIIHLHEYIMHIHGHSQGTPDSTPPPSPIIVTAARTFMKAVLQSQAVFNTTVH